MEFLDKWYGKPSPYIKRLLVGEFNNLCKKVEVRCLRNNIYQTIQVKDYNHLFDLRQSHPRNAPIENPDQLLHSIRKLLWGKRKYLMGDYHSTLEGMFWLSFGLSKKQLENKLKTQ